MNESPIESDPTTVPTRWFKGMASPNPKGRPPGIKSRKVADVLQESGEEVAKVVVDAALAGDMQAAAICMSRLQAPLRARAERVEFRLDVSGTLSQQCAQVLEAVSRGELDIDTAKSIVEVISSFLGLRQVEEIEARIVELESRPAAGVSEVGAMGIGYTRIEETPLYLQFIADLRRKYGLPAPEPEPEP